MADKAPKTRLRIDFVVREVSDDPEADVDSLRFIRFGDFVETHQARDFFDRCGYAMAMMFKPGAQSLSFVNVGPNKIMVIKIIREVTSLGLKEAKDYVEAPLGTPFVVVLNHVDANDIVRRFKAAGCDVEVRGCSVNDNLPPRPGLAALQTYVGADSR